VATAYLVLATSWFIGLWFVHRQASRIDRHTKALEAQTAQIAYATALFCEISERNDTGEKLLVLQVARGQRPVAVTPICQRFVRRVLHPSG